MVEFSILIDSSEACSITPNTAVDPSPPLPYNVPTRLPQTYRLISSEGLPPANGCSKSAHPGPPGSEGEGAEEEEMKWVIIRPKVGLERWQMGR